MLQLDLNLTAMLQRLRGRSSSARRRFVMMNLVELDPLPLGPGWFDSSWELGRGLEVCEDVALDAASQQRLDDVMIAAALVRLRQAAVRAAKAGPAPAKPCTEALAVPFEPAGAASPAGLDNLIEFEPDSAACWALPGQAGARAKAEPAEIELTLA